MAPQAYLTSCVAQHLPRGRRAGGYEQKCVSGDWNADGVQGKVVHTCWTRRTAPSALLDIVLGRIAHRRGLPTFCEARAAYGGNRTTLQQFVPVGPIEVPDVRPLAAGHSSSGTTTISVQLRRAQPFFPLFRYRTS